MRVTFIIITLVIMCLGLLGTVLPVLPGTILIYCGFLFYGVATGWADYGWGVMLFWGLVVLAAFILDHFASALGARKFGASRYGFWGSLAGAIAGVILASLPGLVIGAFAGACLGELAAGKSGTEALRSGKGALVGLLAGALFKIALGVTMIGSFLWWVLARG